MGKPNLRLALDGQLMMLKRGGIRGVVELEILNALEKELGGRLMIQKFFDLIVGTR